MTAMDRINSGLTSARQTNALNQIVGQKNAPISDRSTLERTASQVIAQTFYGTLLRQIQNSPFKSELFSGGRGGQAFGAMFYDHLATKMSSSIDPRLARTLVKRYEKLLPGGAASAGATTQTGKTIAISK